MKYKLINKEGVETPCDKVTIDGYDYYVSDEKEQVVLGRFYYEHDNHVPIYSFTECTLPEQYYLPQVIATTNPNIDIPKVGDEVEKMSWDMVNLMTKLKGHYERIAASWGFKNGYNKSQETHPNSDEDMIEFVDFVEKSMYDTQFKANKELLQLWKEQRIKTIYYE